MLNKIIPLLFSLLLLTGCPAEDPPGGPAGPGEPPAEIEKWNLYVDLSRNLETDLTPALRNYFRIFGYSSEYRQPDQTEYAADFLSTLMANQELATEIDQALSQAADSDNALDQATYEMSLHLKQLWAGLTRARTYHESGRLSPDSYQELHASIYKAYLGLEASRGRFWEVLHKEDAERRQRDIQALADQGRPLRSAMLKLVDAGQSLQDFLSGRGVTSGNLGTVTLDEFRPLYDEFSKNIAEFDRLAGDSPEKLEAEKLTPAELEAYSKAAWVALASASQLMEYRQENTSLGSVPEESAGTPENFGHKLGELVDLYNELNP
ncbi:MAG: YiiG family protein [Candidatus Adiutrix sp.]|jgi:hypothetical protein|nr:YiiG family protein [Candidatus Adiutrix sp.]